MFCLLDLSYLYFMSDETEEVSSVYKYDKSFTKGILRFQWYVLSVYEYGKWTNMCRSLPSLFGLSALVP